MFVFFIENKQIQEQKKKKERKKYVQNVMIMVDF